MSSSEKPDPGSQFWAARGPELTAELETVMAAHRASYAKLLDIVAEMNHENVAKDAGYSSLPAFLVQTLRVSPQKASKMVTQAAQPKRSHPLGM